jgi:hypothetical protein
MLLEGQVGVGLQRCPGSHCLKALPFTEGLPGILWMFASPVRRVRLSQRLMVERETSKEFADLLSWYATIDGGKRLQSEVLRVCIHGEHPRIGPLLTQAAVRKE